MGDLELTVISAGSAERGFVAGFAVTDQVILALGGGGDALVFASSNAQHFELRRTPRSGLRDALPLADQVWTCGEYGLLAVTRDHGESWHRIDTGTTSCLFALTLAQPITKLIAVNAATRLAKADVAIAQAQLEKGRRELLSGVAQAYYGVLGARKIEGALALQVAYAQGLARGSSSPEIRVAVVEARQALNQVQTQTAEVVEQLINLVGLPAGTEVVLDDPTPERHASEHRRVPRSSEHVDAVRAVQPARTPDVGGRVPCREAAPGLDRLERAPRARALGDRAQQEVASVTRAGERPRAPRQERLARHLDGESVERRAPIVHDERSGPVGAGSASGSRLGSGSGAISPGTGIVTGSISMMRLGCPMFMEAPRTASYERTPVTAMGEPVGRVP